MSWYVENLLRGAQSIKNSLMQSENDIVSSNMNSDLYMDLLSVEKTLKDLNERGLLRLFDKKVIELLVNGMTIEEASEKLGVARPTITKRFSAVCDRIAFLLGDNFSDDGYIDYLKEKYNLKDEQISKAIDYMKSSTRRIVVNQR